MRFETLQLHALLETVKLENDDSDITAIYAEPAEVEQETRDIEQAIQDTGAGL